MAPVIEIRLEAGAHLKVTMRRYGDITQVKELMNVGAQQESV